MEQPIRRAPNHKPLRADPALSTRPKDGARQRTRTKRRFWSRLPLVLASLCLIGLILGPMERFWWPLEPLANGTAWIICSLIVLFAIGDKPTRIVVAIGAIVGLLVSFGGVHGSVLFLEAVIVAIGLASMMNRTWTRTLTLCLPLALLPLQATVRFGLGDSFTLLIHDLSASNPTPSILLAQIASSTPDVIVFSAFDMHERDAVRALGYPYDVEDSQPGGPAVFSKLVFVGSQVFQPLGQGAVGAVGARIQTPDGVVTVFGLHASPPDSAQGRIDRDLYLERIHAWMSLNPGPSVVAGDLNLSPFASEWNELDPNHALDGFTPWWDATVPVGPESIGFALDHALTTQGLTSHPIQVLPRSGSDRRGLLVEVSINGT